LLALWYFSLVRVPIGLLKRQQVGALQGGAQFGSA
jgi:hypothetical protein